MSTFNDVGVGTGVVLQHIAENHATSTKIGLIVFGVLAVVMGVFGCILSSQTMIYKPLMPPTPKAKE